MSKVGLLVVVGCFYILSEIHGLSVQLPAQAKILTGVQSRTLNSSSDTSGFRLEPKTQSEGSSVVTAKPQVTRELPESPIDFNILDYLEDNDEEFPWDISDEGSLTEAETIHTRQKRATCDCFCRKKGWRCVPKTRKRSTEKKCKCSCRRRGRKCIVRVLQ